MAIQYQWDAEVWTLDVAGELAEIEHWHHNRAHQMLDHMVRYAELGEGEEYHPVVVRDTFGPQDELLDRQWAYMVKGDSGLWYLPEYFVDGEERKGAKVPQYLKNDLEKAQK